MPKFDETIQNAIVKAVDREGSQASLCKKIGISTSIMSRYVNGNVETINFGTWNMLFPHIKEFLPETYHRQFLAWKPLEAWQEFEKENPTFKMLADNIEHMDINEIAKTSPLYGVLPEKLNAINLIKDKLAYGTQATLNKILRLLMDDEETVKNNENHQKQNP